jgi:hypothetical protein
MHPSSIAIYRHQAAHFAYFLTDIWTWQPRNSLLTKDLGRQEIIEWERTGRFPSVSRSAESVKPEYPGKFGRNSFHFAPRLLSLIFYYKDDLRGRRLREFLFGTGARPILVC